MADQSARVDAADDGDPLAGEESFGTLVGAPVAGEVRELADDETFNVGFDRFVVFGGRAVIADLGICENDDLPGVLAKILGLA